MIGIKRLALGAALLVAAAHSQLSQPAALELAAQRTGYSFADVSGQSGIVLEHRRSWGSVWGDYDRDGDPDLLVNRHYLRPFFYDNTSEGYQHAAWEPTLRTPEFDRHGCLWGDPNEDGLADLFCTQGAQKGKGSGPNQLLIQDVGGSFTDRAAAMGVDYPEARSRTANWVDYDSDGDLDLFIGAQSRTGYPSRMFRNDNGRFTLARVGLEDELRTQLSAWADWDRDGDLDVLLTLKARKTAAYENRGGRFRRVKVPRVTSSEWHSAAFGNFDRDRWPDLHLVNPRRSLVLRNRRGRFVPVHEVRRREGHMGLWFDADNDGDQDIFVVRGAPGMGDDPDAADKPDLLLIRQGAGFRKRAVRSSGVAGGNGDSAAVADHDRDGRLDLFVTNGYKRATGPYVLLENRSRARRWAALRLDGGPGDPFGMWARVRVATGKRVYWRHLSDGVVGRSQSEVGFTHLGLRGAGAARVRVVWLDGSRDCIRAPAGTVTDLRKNTSPCR